MLVTNYIRRQQDQYHIRAIQTSMHSSRETILRNTAMTGMCEVVHCTVSSHGEQWLPGVSYPVYIAKRIDLEVELDVAVNRCEETPQDNAEEMEGMEYADCEEKN